MLAERFAAAHTGFTDGVEIGQRFRSADLIALARHGQGRSLLRLNRVGEGLALLDEVMVAVTGGEVAPLVTGVVYCGVISACHEMFDLRRAHEWTAAMERWCAANPDLGPLPRPMRRPTDPRCCSGTARGSTPSTKRSAPARA